MKIYYAHPETWYGTDREKDDLASIAKNLPIGAEIINPADKTHSDVADGIKGANPDNPDVGGMVMEYFLSLVRSADLIAYRTFDDDFIGAGVALEVFTAHTHGLQIWRMLDLTRDKGPMPFAQQGLRVSFGPKVLTIADTRLRIKRGVM